MKPVPMPDPDQARPFIIAIDGPAASGKGTLAGRLAAHFGFARLDTGKLYRAVARRMLRSGADPGDPEAARLSADMIDAAALDDPDLGREEVAQAASVVAAHPAVRASLLAFQRDFAARPPGGSPGAVLDGRDIGTVVCPDAAVKIFVDASPEVRAERRLKELLDRGETSIKARVLRDMQARDTRDRGRSDAPLKPAPDAVILDTSRLDAEQAFAAALAIVHSKRG